MTQITSATVNRATDKQTGEVFYGVKSDHEEKWYEVRWNTERYQWECNCPNVRPCKHERAVNEVLAEKRKQALRSAPLNGSREFSLLK